MKTCGQDVTCKPVRLSVAARRAGRAFTLVELLVVVAVISLLASMLLPSMGNAVQMGYKARCLDHLRELMQCHLAYAMDNQNYLPGPAGVVDWQSSLNAPWGICACMPIQTGTLYKCGYVKNPKMWLCPAVTLKSPGDYYMKYPEASFVPNPPWTQQQVDANPYTYHYSYNARAMMNRACDAGGAAPSSPYHEWEGWAGYLTPDGHWYVTCQRKIDSFSDAQRVVVLAEENTGKVYWDGTWMGAGQGVLNDPFFVDPDVTENRHLNSSVVGYVDGRAGELPPGINLTTIPGYLCAPMGSQ